MLKAILNKAEYEVLSPELKKEYKAGTEELKDSFILDVENVSTTFGAVYALENVAGLKSALASERENAKKLKKIAESVEGLDLDEAKSAMKKLKDMKDWTPEQKVQEQIAAVQKQLTDKFGKELKEKETKLTSVTSQLEKTLVDNEAIKALGEHKGSVDLLLPHIRMKTKITEKDGKLIVEVIGKDGVPRISNKSGSTDPMSIGELVAEMKTDETFSRAFDGARASGSGASGGGRTNGSGQYVLSSSDARDPQKYRAAKEAAEKAGASLQIEE